MATTEIPAGNGGGGGGGTTALHCTAQVTGVVTVANAMGQTKWTAGTAALQSGEASWWDGTALEITPPTAGWYHVRVSVLWQSGANINDRRGCGYKTDGTQKPSGGHYNRAHDTGGLYTMQNTGMVYVDGTQGIWATYACLSSDTLDMRLEVVGPLAS